MKLLHFVGATLPALAILAYAAAALVYTVPTPGAEALHWKCGIASWYGLESGSVTATGEHFDGSSLTAAMLSRSEFGHRYRVHYGSKSVDVRINDTGGFAKYGRIIDLSRAAALKIGLIGPGTGHVCLERLS